MNDSEQKIRALPPIVEVVIVLIIAFGWYIFVSLKAFLSWNFSYYLTEEFLIEDTAIQLLTLAVLGWFLHTRGWTFRDVGLEPTWRSTVTGLALFAFLVMAESILRLSQYLLKFGFSEQFSILISAYLASVWPFGESKIGLVTNIISSLVNGFYEELFCCAYLITVLRRWDDSAWLAIMASTLLRLSYHLYQGPASVHFIIFWGLIFALFYVQTRQLWPLVVAHALQDVYAIAYL